MNSHVTLLVFLLDGQRYALHLETVARVIPAVEVTPLPHAPAVVHGIINVGGQVIPLVSLRERFSLPPREIDVSDHIIIAHTPARTVGLWVDAAEGLVSTPHEQIVAAPEVLPHLEHIEGVIKLEDGLLLIQDLSRCLSLEEDAALAVAIEEA